MNPAIFRPYDIRGIVDQDFTETDFKLIGQGFAKYLLDRGAKSTSIGRDNRLHSAKLQASFMQGLLSSGIDVVDLGEITTPMSYFSLSLLGVEGSVCITASHNSAEWNGAKMSYKNGSIQEEEIKEVANNVALKRFEEGQGKLTTKDITKPYLQMIQEKCDFAFIKKNLKQRRIGIDCGNGMAGKYVLSLFKDLGVELYPLYPELDGSFPHHTPNPADGANLKDLWNLSKEKKLDLCFGYDGDVDRLNVIDDQGFVLWGDGLIIFYAREVLEKMPGSNILYDSLSSPAVAEDVVSHHGLSTMLPTGRALIVHELHRTQSPMAGEYSGHMFFLDRFLGYDDAIYATFRMLHILAEKNLPLSKIMANVPTYLTDSLTNLPVPEEKKKIVIDSLNSMLSDRYFVQRIGGLRVKIGPTWASIHPSGTEPAIRLAVWGKDNLAIEKTRQFLIKAINKLL